MPLLRNIAETGPYFHVDDFSRAIETMAIIQLGRELSDEEIEQIKTFLNSLTGEIPEYALEDKDPRVAEL